MKKEIIKLIIFFDLFDCPLTSFEVWQKINVKSDLESVIKKLDELVIDNEVINSDKGFYFLKNRDCVVDIRMDRYKYADKKFKRVLFVTKIFRLLPWLKMVAIGNIIGSHNLKKEGDIDFFIVTEKNRIWITRFFCVLIVGLLGLRPTKKNTQDKICLSFFVDEESLGLQKFLLKENDLYFIYWLADFFPVYDAGNFYEKLIKDNQWFSDYLPNWQLKEVSCLRRVQKLKFNFLFFIILFGGLEKVFKKVSIKKMNPELKKMKNSDNRVIVNDRVLKLHTNDRREQYLSNWKNKVRALGDVSENNFF